MARFSFKDEDKRLWALVTATVRPRDVKKVRPESPEKTETLTVKGMPEGQNVMTAAVIKPQSPEALTPFKIGQALKPQTGFRLSFDSPVFEPDPIEPRRKRRLSRERDAIEARLDLHGLNAIAAEARLKAFVTQAFQNDYRAILVITGKGLSENGILKRHTPEWLAAPELSHMVAGISQAHARHGGTGALYVALKRRRA
jgi:DNA-nicking Smr family endonuclease